MDTQKRKTAIFRLPFITPLLLLLTLLSTRIIDNDLWWILSIGKSIINDGIPVADPLSMHEGLDFVAQQWLTSVVFRSIYDVFGYAGMILMVLCINVLIFYLMSRLCTIIGGTSRMTGIISAVSSALLVYAFGVSRPQVFTICIIITEIILLEEYTSTNKWQYLIPLPLMSILEINLHSSMWLMLFVIGAPYVLEYILKWFPWRLSHKSRIKAGRPSEDPRTYRLTPLWIVCASMLGCGLINPYGIKAMTYLFTSYGSSLINEIVDEMKSPSMKSSPVLFVLMMAIIVFVCRTRKKLPVRYIILVAGTMYLALSSVKGSAYALIAAAPVLAYSYSDIPVPESIRKNPLIPVKYKRTMTTILCVFAVIIVGAKGIWIGCTDDIKSEDVFSVADALDYVESHCEITQESRIYADYNTGGYFEFCGYKPYIDARAEVFLKANNGKKDILQEFRETILNPYKCGKFIDEYDFDYIFVSSNNAINAYLSYTSDTGYIKIFEANDEDKESDIYVWKKCIEKETKNG